MSSDSLPFRLVSWTEILLALIRMLYAMTIKKNIKASSHYFYDRIIKIGRHDGCDEIILN